MSESAPRELLFAALIALASLACAGPTPEAVEDTVDAGSVAERARRASAARIVWLEDRRSDGGLELQRLALADDSATRERAVRALGRLPYPELGAEVTRALTRALEDPVPRVRALAAFGLGLRADPTSIEALLAAWQDEDEEVRARLVEAASRFEDRSLREEVMYALSDPSPIVRAQAAMAPHRWDTGSNAAGVVDSALANVAAKAPAKLRQERWDLPEGDSFEVEPEDPEVIWRALFSLARRESERGREVFYLWCRAPDRPLARLFAMRGLASLEESNEATRDALREGLSDPDWRVAVEAATALGRFPEAASIPGMERALEHPSSHLRATVAKSLGAFRGERLLARPLLERCLVDVSPSVRGAAIHSLTRLFREDAPADLEARALDTDPVVRKSVALSCAELPAPNALPLLARLVRDDDSAVAYAAAKGLGDFIDEGGRPLTRELLESRDNGMRLAAVLALQEGPVPDDLSHLHRCYLSSEGDIADEIRAEILRVAGQFEDDRAFEILREGLADGRAFNRELARELFVERFSRERLPDPSPLPPRTGDVPEPPPPGARPRVEVRTSRGTMVFELYPEQAPVHAHNFLTLAGEGAYDGLLFHRVVPDFVIQGGDYRGDGNGGVSWREEPLRHEFNELPYVEGSLGMPRNADPDSGGSQFFVTHRPTPHLDGRYTLFGQLTHGFEVLREIEEGDRILSVQARGR